MYVIRIHSNGPAGPKGVGSVLRWLECLQTAIRFSWLLFVSTIFLSDSTLHEMNINLRVLYFEYVTGDDNQTGIWWYYVDAQVVLFLFRLCYVKPKLKCVQFPKTASHVKR